MPEDDSVSYDLLCRPLKKHVAQTTRQKIHAANHATRGNICLLGLHMARVVGSRCSHLRHLPLDDVAAARKSHAAATNNTFSEDLKLSREEVEVYMHEKDSQWSIVKSEPLAVYLRPKKSAVAVNGPANKTSIEKSTLQSAKHGCKLTGKRSALLLNGWPKLESLADSESVDNSSKFANDIPESDEVILNLDDDDVISRFSRISLTTWNEPPALARLSLPATCKELCFLARNFIVRTWFEQPDQYLELDAVLGHALILQYGRQFVHAFREHQRLSAVDRDNVDKVKSPFGEVSKEAGAGVKWYQIVRNLHRYLTRHAHINFGHCLRDLSRVSDENLLLGNHRRQAQLHQTQAEKKRGGNGSTSVVIVGAGLAGLAAARHLLNLGISNVKVLEARSQPGGRVNTIWCSENGDFSPKQQSENNQHRKMPRRNGLKNGHHQNHACKIEPAMKIARAELGAQVLTGVKGNPLCLVAHQLRLPLRRIAANCAIFDKDGSVTDAGRDGEIEAEFNNILENASRISHFQGLEAHDGQLLSLGRVFDAVVRCNELETERMRLGQLDVAEQMLRRAQQLMREQISIQEQMQKVMKVVKSLLSDSAKTNGSIARVKLEPGSEKCVQKHDGVVCALRSPIHQTFDLCDNIGGELLPLRERYDFLQNEIEKLQEKSRDVSEDFSAKRALQPLYLSSSDKDILHWHISNLEFANAAPIHDLSLKHWDQDEHFDAVVGGDDCMMPAGLTTLCTELLAPFTVIERGAQSEVKPHRKGRSKKVVNVCFRNGRSAAQENSASITFDAKVTEINYSLRGKCRVSYKVLENADENVIDADFVILTTSLGVLKLCCNNNDKLAGVALPETRSSKTKPKSDADVVSPPIRFKPSLPNWKQGAIKRLGFGRLNKLVMLFEYNFWSEHLPNSDDMLFGYADDHRRNERLGECYIFWSMSVQNKLAKNADEREPAVLVAMLAGNAAKLAEDVESNAENCPADTQQNKRDAAAAQLATRAMEILQHLFGREKPISGEKCVESVKKIPSPQLVVLTRWACDPNFCGTYSYVARGATGDDYDAMAAPVYPPLPSSTAKEEFTPIPRLLFAGEATIRRCPASAHGAYFSGLREAARIDAILNGPIKF